MKTTAEIVAHTSALKQDYWNLLHDLTVEQGAIWLAFVRDAAREEVERGEHLDRRGKWLLAVTLAAVGFVLGAARITLDTPDGTPWTFASVTGIAILLLLVVSLICVHRGTRVRATFFGADPELLLRPKYVGSTSSELQRTLILHYVQNFGSNKGISDQKADWLQRGEWSLLAAVVLSVLAGVLRVVMLLSP